VKGSNSKVPCLFLIAVSICKVAENVKVIGEIMTAHRPDMIFFRVAMNCLRSQHCPI